MFLVLVKKIIIIINMKHCSIHVVIRVPQHSFSFLFFYFFAKCFSFLLCYDKFSPFYV
jgi:hypothetical protein